MAVERILHGAAACEDVAGDPSNAPHLHYGRPLRIAVINETYTPEMGYAENCLSQALADTGAEVHVVATSLPPNYYMHDYKQSYGAFLGKGGASPDLLDGLNPSRFLEDR